MTTITRCSLLRRFSKIGYRLSNHNVNYFCLITITHILCTINSAETEKLSKSQRDKEIISLYIYVHNTVDFSKLDINSKVYPNANRLKVKIGDKLEAVCPQAFVEANGFTMTQWKKAKKTVI